MGRAGVVRGWRGLGVNSFDLVGWSGATLLGEVGHRDHQNPKGEQYSESEWCSDQQANIHFVPSHCYAPPVQCDLKASRLRQAKKRAANRDLGRTGAIPPDRARLNGKVAKSLGIGTGTVHRISNELG
jgi:hypothetical protein